MCKNINVSKTCRHKCVYILIWATSWKNQQNGMCTQQRLRSAWASAQSDQSLLCAQWVAKDLSFLHVDSEDSDLTRRVPRLIWVFAGPTCHFVGFVMRRLICLKCADWKAKQTLLKQSDLGLHCLPRLVCRIFTVIRIIFLYCWWAHGAGGNAIIGLWNITCATSRENVSSRIFDQVRFKPAYSATETSYNLETLDRESIRIILP